MDSKICLKYFKKFFKNAFGFGVKEFIVFVVNLVVNISRWFKLVPRIMFQMANFDCPVNQDSLHHTCSWALPAAPSTSPCHVSPLIGSQGCRAVASDWMKTRASRHKTYWQTDMERGRVAWSLALSLLRHTKGHKGKQGFVQQHIIYTSNEVWGMGGRCISCNTNSQYV